MFFDDSESRITEFVRLQQQRNDRYPYRADETDVPLQFRPDGPDASLGFDLPYALLPESSEGCELFEFRPEGPLRSWVHVGDRLRFPIHPLMVSQHRTPNLCSATRARALASVRTVIVEQDGYAFMVKTDMPGKVGFTRRLRHGSIAHSRDVMRALSNVRFPSCCGFLPETISISLRTTDATGVPLETGCVYRDLTAWPRTDQPRRLVPFFSLWSRGPNRDEPMLLCQLVEHNRLAGEDEFDTFCRIVLDPLIESVTYLVTEHGLLPEAHAQNTFLEMDDLGQVTRVIHADLQDFCFDRDVRNRKGLTCEFTRNEVSFLHSHLEGPAEVLAFPARQIRYSSLFHFVLGRMLAPVP